ncbi:MAG: DUF4428 domain-containing protein, partial [Collinsella sp.]
MGHVSQLWRLLEPSGYREGSRTPPSSIVTHATSWWEATMGFFDKMFEKKECAICGTELGLLGKTKINEGYLCKECAGKLSPYFHG